MVYVYLVEGVRLKRVKASPAVASNPLITSVIQPQEYCA
jgi:hypothetical protein